MSFEVIGCQLLHFGPHRTIPNRITGAVRVRIREDLLGNTTQYTLDLPVKSDCGKVPHEQVRTALLTHAAHQLNKLKARHAERLAPARPIAAE
ncbi:MAG: hypothetical protein ABS75_24345 [Pelagibacterium sp. SCN 63-23]|nr:MAG: hypothetical protein ABS75_24345 [Pelagibacterium sp. SCN 63-23]